MTNLPPSNLPGFEPTKSQGEASHWLAEAKASYGQSSILPTPAAEWDSLLLAHQGHLLQSWAWGELKGRFGWSAVRVRMPRGQAAAQILFRRLPLGLTLAYIPRGPVVEWTNNEQCRSLFELIHAEAKKRRAILLKVEPNLWSTDFSLDLSQNEAVISFLKTSSFTPADTIQPRTSLVIDLSGDEAALLAAMKQKTRYNIRLAEKKGVTIRHGHVEDITTFYQLTQITAARDSFGVHSLDYYRSAYNLFAPDRCALLIAEFEGRPLAALMAFSFGQEAYYFYGASANEQRNLMAPYLLQWEAIRWAKSQGCTRYDFWGVPDADPVTLEAEFEQRHDGLWKVYRFKRGFGGQWTKSLGAFDYIYNPPLYQFYKLFRRR